MDLSKWLEPGTSSIKARVVGVDSATDDIAYSEPRYFEVRNQDRYYVDMIQPMGRRTHGSATLSRWQLRRSQYRGGGP